MRKVILLVVSFHIYFLIGCTVTINATHCEINVKQETVSIPNGNGYYDFDNVPIYYDETVKFTIENLGNSSLYLDPNKMIEITGIDKDAFSLLTDETKAIILPESFTTFSVKFSPDNVGKKYAIISIYNNDKNENPYTFMIIGTGVTIKAEINVKTNVGDIPCNSGVYDFGITKLYASSDFVTFTIENNGNTELILSGNPDLISISGVDSSLFIIDQTSTNSIIDGLSSTFFKIAFHPTSKGIKTAKISIINSDDNENPYVFTITGICASAPEINILQDGKTIFNNTGIYDFEKVTINETKEIEFTIENNGTSILHLSGTPDLIKISGTDATMFSANSSTTIYNLLPGNKTYFKLSFTPTSIGSKTAIVSIPNNDDNEDPYTFTLNGICVVPDINIKHLNYNIPNTGSFDFGFIYVGQTSGPLVFDIENLGEGILKLTGFTKVSITGTDASMFSVDSSATASEIESMKKTTFTISFNPTSPGAKTATIVIVNNDPDESAYNFEIKGVGLDNQLGYAVGWIGNDQDGWQRSTAGSYGSSYRKFNAPCGTVVDSEGNIYIADSLNNRICKWTSSGYAVGWIGGGSNGWKTTSGTLHGRDYKSFYEPKGIYVDASGNIYVADFYNHRISKWDKKGNAIGWIGGKNTTWTTKTTNTTTDRGSDYQSFFYPIDVHVDNAGFIYVADKYNHRISKWSAQGSAIGWIGNNLDGWQTGIAPSVGRSDYKAFDNPSGVALDTSGNIYITDKENNRISKWNSQGIAQGWIGGGYDGWQKSNSPNSGTGYKHFAKPFGICVSKGYIYISESVNQRISKWSLSGNAVGWIGGGSDGWKTTNAPSGDVDYQSFNNPQDVFVDSKGNIFVADRYNSRIDKWLD